MSLIPMLVLAGAGLCGPEWHVKRLDSATIPHDWGRGEHASIPVVELSGIEALGHGWNVAVSDDRGQTAPPRYGFLRVDFMKHPETGEPKFRSIGRVDQHLFLNEQGEPYAPNILDPESIRLLGEANQSRQFLVASEGRAKDGIGTSLILYDQVEGAEPLDLTPEKFAPDENRGIRNNRGFEALGVTPDGRWAYAANEEPLAQEEASEAVRILEIDLVTRRVTAEFAYPLGPATLSDDPKQLGLVELIAIERGRLIALERDEDGEGGFDGRLYHVEVHTSEDVASVDPLQALPVRPAVKFRLATLSELGVPTANYEGMCLSNPHGEDGQLLILVSDNDAQEGVETHFELLLIEGIREGGPLQPAGPGW